MCGITAFFARESAIDHKHLDTIFSWTEKRGKDGFGFVLISKNKHGNRSVKRIFRSSKPYSKCKEEVVNSLFKDSPYLHIGDVIIAISRASPETEGETVEGNLPETMQPIVTNDKPQLVCVHNGAVSNKIHRELQKWAAESGEYKFNSKIDSESILASYVKHQKNMKDAMEYLSGGFAAIVFDEEKDMLYTIVDFKPLAHAYVKGFGFFLHSDVDCLREVIYDYTGCNRDGEFLWESWYGHYLSPGIREIDLQSGFMRKVKYSSRYITSTWDSNAKKENV